MKVVYKSIYDAIIDAETRAALNNREISHIILNDAEYEEMMTTERQTGLFAKVSEEPPIKEIGMVSGVKLFIIDKLKLRRRKPNGSI